MKIFILECTAEELSANRTVMDTLNNVLNNFTDRLFGINNINFAEAMSNIEEEEEQDGSI